MVKRIFPFALPLVLFCALTAGCNSSDNSASSQTKSRAVSVKLLHTNDHHSHLDSDAYDLSFDGVSTRVEMGGFGRIATLIEQERDDHSIVVNSGELNGTLYFSMFKGEPDFKVFNALGLDGYTLGNHEFDEGDGRLAELIDMADFPILSSNMTPEEASPLYAVKDKIKPYVIKEIDGEKIGIIGILKVEKTKNSSLVSDDVTFTAEIEAARQCVAELEANGVNKIILVSHVGYYNDILFAREVEGLDVIVGGDTHSLLGNPDDLDAIGLSQNYDGQTGPFEGYTHDGVEDEALGSYPTTVTGPGGDPVHVVQAWNYAYALGMLNVDFDENGVAVRAEGHITIPVGDTFLQKNDAGERVEVSSDVKSRIMAAIDASPVIAVANVSETVDELIAPYRNEIDASMTQVIGTIAETMGFERIPTPFAQGETPTGSYAAQVVCEAFKRANPRIDVAIQNAGGVRTQFLAGPFTVGDAITALPFANTVVMLDMTGAEIRNVLNEAAYYALNSGSTGAFPYAAGLRYDVNLGGDENGVILNVEMLNTGTGSWEALNDAGSYTVATNSFTALGKDNYLTFKTVRDADPSRFEDTYIAYYVPLKEYIEGLPDQTLPPLDVQTYCLKSVVE